MADDWQPRPGEMHPVDQAFYDMTVKERDYERVVADRLRRELAAEKREHALTLRALASMRVALEESEAARRDGLHAAAEALEVADVEGGAI